MFNNKNYDFSWIYFTVNFTSIYLCRTLICVFLFSLAVLFSVAVCCCHGRVSKINSHEEDAGK